MERYTTSRIPFARPAGVEHPREAYDGADLAPRCTRPGAYDALRLPSMFNGRSAHPVEPKAPPPAPPIRITQRARISVSQAVEPAAEAEVLHAPPQPAPLPQGGYLPARGSRAARVLADLRLLPVLTPFTGAEIEDRFGISRDLVHGTLAMCVKHGLLVKLKKGASVAYAVPAAAPRSSLPPHEPPALANAA